MLLLSRNSLPTRLCWLAVSACAVVFSGRLLAEEPALDFTKASESLRKSCGECHSDETAEGGFKLSRLGDEATLKLEFEQWHKVRQRVLDRSMPPMDAEPLADDVRDAVTAWIEAASLEAICQDGPQAGPPLLRRLAKHEYSNSIRDLLNIHFDAGQGLPDDVAGGEGFANAAETLIISPIHAEKFLDAATDALDYAARDARARERLLPARPGENTSEEDAARQNLRRLADRAFRRPAADDEVEQYVVLFRDARAEELAFDDAVLYAMRGVLISPEFLFISESLPTEPGVAVPLTDHELATRLSYFLWASTPDEELRKAADEGKLSNDDELKRQVERMLTARGTHLLDSMEQFVGNWLGTADVGRTRQIDRERHDWIEEPHVAALRDQPVYAMESILDKNESLLLLIDAPWTFLNDELARVYRIRKDKLEDKFVQNLVRVNLPEEYRIRGGVLGMGGPMVVSSYPRRSSPVLRGAWVLEKLLGVELPPPPPDVPKLDESEEVAQATTLRERFELHRRNPACASCHDRIDPIGFALENFDEVGRWRTKDDGGKIDSVANLADGTEINGVEGLKKYVLDNKSTFIRVVTRKMLGYALGRSLRPADLCTIESIVHRLEQNEYRSHELILGIVQSEPFRQKMTEVQDQ